MYKLRILQINLNFIEIKIGENLGGNKMKRKQSAKQGHSIMSGLACGTGWA